MKTTNKGKLRFCNEDCNNCDVVESRELALVLNSLYEIFGDKVYQVVQHHCPNMTVCPDCRIDDFCHEEGCEIIDEAEKYAKKHGPKPEENSKTRDYWLGYEAGFQHAKSIYVFEEQEP